jgi:hypothetical protein
LPVSARKSVTALVIENLDEIDPWRSELDDKARRRLNHPGAVWHAWRRACGDHKKLPAQHRDAIVQREAAAAETARRGRAVYWPQDALRRARDAMIGSRSSDLLVLARVALQAAIRNEGDLIEPLSPDALAMSAFTQKADIVGTVGYVR